MYVSFDDLPGDSRLWIYQANRIFTPQEKAAIESSLVHLCETWMAHGTPLRTSFRIDYDLFIVLAVDERQAGASGCSIDGTVRLLKDLQQRLGVDFFNRQMAAFRSGTSAVLHPLQDLKGLFQNGILPLDSLTFNNALTTKADWEQEWQIPVRESWLSRYLPKPAGASTT